jgi:Concanavalin A-like lectin/glucanases superfamily
VSIVDFTDGNGPTFDFGLGMPQAPQYLEAGTNSSTSDCEGPGTGNPLNVEDTTTSFSPQIGSWYNAIVEFSHGTLTTYINGKLVSTKGGGSDSVLFCPNASFVVGGWWAGHENINGELDEVRFYNRTLNPQQIAWLSRNFQPNSISTKASPGLKSSRPSPIAGN